MFDIDEATGEDVAAALVEVLERLRGMTRASARASAWPAAARLSVLAGLDEASAVIGLVRAPVVLAERDAGTSQRVGDKSFEASVGRASGKGFVEARREVRQAETLAAMPSIAEAVGSGGMTLAHVDAVAKVVAGADGVAGAGVLGTAAGQAAVVELARGRDAGEFGKDLARYVAASDPAAHDRDHATQRAERYLVLSDQPNGTFLKGRLDRFAGERLRLALESTGIEPDGERNRPQAMADALVSLADTALTGAGTGASASRRRPHVSVLLHEETFAALLADQRARVRRETPAASDGLRAVGLEPEASRADGSPATDRDPRTSTPAPAALSESGSPVPRSEVARILCDATVARIVVDADDVPLNIGRDTRLYTGAQRRAVIARDKQCAWPGCGIPARWSEVHHIRWWVRDGGETSVENGVLLCEHHHHLVHQHDLVIRRHSSGATGGSVRRSEADPAPPGVAYTFRTRSGRVVAPAPSPEQTLSRALRRAATVRVPERPVPEGPVPERSVPERSALERSVPGRPTPIGPPGSGPAGRSTAPAAGRGAPGGRRAVQPSFLDELIAAQPPDPPF